jgi:uroporphyrin-3 C-methyltransferase
LTEQDKPKSKPKPKQPTIDTKVADKKPVAKSKPEKRSKPSSGFLKALARMLLIVFIIGASSAGWLFWQDWQVKMRNIDSNSAVLSSLESSISSVKNQSQLVIEQQRQQHKAALQLGSQLNNIELRVNAQGKRLIELGSTTRSDWLLAEAEYLARLARQRLQTERSVKSSLALLQSVDAILTQIDDPNLLQARGAVAADITSLRLTPDVDREGIYLELQALASSVDKLLLVELAEPQKSVQQPLEKPDQQKQTVLDEFLTDLSSLVRVRQRQNPIEPILLPYEERIVRRNMQMIFEQAQLSLLREEQKIYRATLEKAQHYLQRFFQSNPASQAVNQRIAVLLDTSITQQIPDVHNSLEAIQALLIMREQRIIEGEKSIPLESGQ